MAKKDERVNAKKLPDGRLMPLERLQWIDREKITPNGYNPNSVAPPELELLKRSILEDGWTQPIVINPDFTIVDGFHRWTVSGHKEINELTNGQVPVVILEPQSEEHQKMSTVRHNRARGRHSVLSMGRIVADMQNSGMKDKEIMQRLGMEKEEIIRLTNTQGVMSHPDLDKPYSKAWKPE